MFIKRLNVMWMLFFAVALPAMRRPLQKQPVSDPTAITIFQAARDGKINVIQRMIQERKNLNLADADGNTPLMHASRHGHVDVVNALITAGAKRDIKNHADQNALFVAVENNKSQVVDALLKAGESANQREEHGLGGGRTLLMIATQNNNPDIVKLLVEAGANRELRAPGLHPIQKRTAEQMTPTHADTELKSYLELKKEKIR